MGQLRRVCSLTLQLALLIEVSLAAPTLPDRFADGGPMKACPNCHTSYPLNYTHCPRDGSALIEAGSWQEGTVVRGKYRILGKLGEGGMAVVYKAMHTRFEELRALKVMNVELAHDHDFVKRFLQEAVLTRKIQHPNAVRVDDIDEAEDGRPFMVMEFLDGCGLKDAIEAQAPMAPQRVSRTARQVAGALSAAHRLGVVHRDVKPANIVLIAPNRLPGAQPGEVAEEEQAKVLDFGIAKAKEVRLEGQATLTRTGNVIGTPTYMSPEQARGMRGADLDGRSDLYSLGIVMYQMLAGGLPFKADTSMQWILAHLQEPPKPFRELRADLDIPPALADVVMRCLEKDPARRPATAEALIEQLERAEGQMPGATASRGTGRTWAQANGSPAAKSAKSESRQQTAGSEAATSRRWMGWTAVVLVVFAIAGALWVWRVQSAIWTARPTPILVQKGTPPAQQKTQPSDSSANPGSTLQAPAQPVQPPPAAPLQEQAHAADASDAPAAKPNSTSSATPDPPSVQKKPAAKPPGFAVAVSRARDDESQGRFEEALREYELAAAIDPSDASVKRHISLLKDRISKENDLIR